MHAMIGAGQLGTREAARRRSTLPLTLAGLEELKRHSTVSNGSWFNFFTLNLITRLI